MVDAVTKALIDTLGAAGVTVAHEGTPDVQHRVTAIDPDTRETYIVTHPDLYSGICHSAQRVGLDLEDG